MIEKHFPTLPGLDPITEYAARKALADIRDRYEVKQAFVYGSRARGTHHPDSDLDLAVLLHGKREKFMDVVFDMSDIACDTLLETGILVEPLPIWFNEWEHPEKYSNPNLISNIKRDGVLL